VQRYEIRTPGVNDNEFVTWQEYGVRAWPTFMVIDPFGKVVGQLSGEPLYSRIQPIIDTMVSEYGANGALNLEPLPQIDPVLADVAEDTPLRFPGKVLADPAGNRLFISDSNHHRIVVAALDTFEVLDVIGSGEAGWSMACMRTRRLRGRKGLALDGSTLSWPIRSTTRSGRWTLTRERWRPSPGRASRASTATRAGRARRCSSPRRGTWWRSRAGFISPWPGRTSYGSYDIASGEVGPYAGSGREALLDGRLREAGMNQPSGIDSDGGLLVFADPEASAIRTADLDPDGEVRTIVGTGLFDFGDVDGTGDEVRLQHALGVTVADDGYLYVADTYNNKIKRIDPQTRESVNVPRHWRGGLRGRRPVAVLRAGRDRLRGWQAVYRRHEQPRDPRGGCRQRRGHDGYLPERRAVDRRGRVWPRLRTRRRSKRWSRMRETARSSSRCSWSAPARARSASR